THQCVLVPRLCLGTPCREALPRSRVAPEDFMPSVGRGPGGRASPKCVPRQSLGTRENQKPETSEDILCVSPANFSHRYYGGTMKSLLRQLSRSLSPAPRPPRRRPRPEVERLEDRWTPANLDVNAAGVAQLIADPFELNDITLVLNPATARYEF